MWYRRISESINPYSIATTINTINWIIKTATSRLINNGEASLIWTQEISFIINLRKLLIYLINWTIRVIICSTIINNHIQPAHSSIISQRLTNSTDLCYRLQIVIIINTSPTISNKNYNNKSRININNYRRTILFSLNSII